MSLGVPFNKLGNIGGEDLGLVLNSLVRGPGMTSGERSTS